MDNKVSYLKIRKVKTPYHANVNDAGTDFYIPDYSESFFKELQAKNANNSLIYNTHIDEKTKEPILDIFILPFSSVNIPSGIRVWIHDKNTFLQATNKSGIASKLELDVMANTIDADFKGEVIFNLHNTTGHQVQISSGTRIVQLIHREYIHTDWQEVDEKTYKEFGETDRGEGGFGASGDK